jgi:hypothetical protein
LFDTRTCQSKVIEAHNRNVSANARISDTVWFLNLFLLLYPDLPPLLTSSVFEKQLYSPVSGLPVGAKIKVRPFFSLKSTANINENVVNRFSKLFPVIRCPNSLGTK